jgi:2-oxoisovalerate dehydrogenase E1 component
LQDLYGHMIAAREVDRLEQQYTARGEAFFHVSGAGHEATAALAPHLSPDDWLHCHYRDKALLLARGVTPEMFFASLFCKDSSSSRGRQMSAHMSWRPGNVLSLCGPVGNNALQAVGVAAHVRPRPGAPIVLCALGDGTTQEGEVLEAIAEAVRDCLPVLFLVEDNRFAISTRTRGRTFYSLPGSEPATFYGIPICRIDGRKAAACYRAFGEIVAQMRLTREPALVVMEVERLGDHTNADDQSVYREGSEIASSRVGSDPIAVLASELGALGVSDAELDELTAKVVEKVKAAATRARAGAEPQSMPSAKKPLAPELHAALREQRGLVDGRDLTMIAAMQSVLRLRMREDARITLSGQDIEDPKGDVFGITRGLSTEFPGRVRNAALSESTIVGTAIGRALAGGRPVAFLQFADFLPLAFNQIASELGSMYWRTDGSWECPVIVMIPCGGYRPGLGPFHAQSLEALAMHVPGIDVFMPSSAADAAGLLNAAFDSGRPTLFFYPKALLNDRTVATSRNVREQFVPIGRARLERRGDDLTLVGYGNAMERCRLAADALATVGVRTDLIDLRSLSPWDEHAVLASARRTGHVLVVHEDNQSCGMGAEVLATIAQSAGMAVKMARVTRADTFVPCNFSNQLEILPSFRGVLTAAATLLELDLEWQEPDLACAELFIVEAVGSSPSDESVVMVECVVAAGDTIREGDRLGTFETAKALMDLESSVTGTVEEIFVLPGATVKIGAPLLSVRLREKNAPLARQAVVENAGIPLLRRRTTQPSTKTTGSEQRASHALHRVGISTVAVALGARVVENDDLVRYFPGKTAQDVVNVTGIERRRQIGPDQDVLSLGAEAAASALQRADLGLADVDMIVCATGTPGVTTPSVACQILYRLGGTSAQCQAHDISAACSGYLYGLQTAFDFLQSRPGARVLLVTSEVLSPLLDRSDFGTAFIFGDAATATVVCGEAGLAECRVRLDRPELSAEGEAGRFLRVPAAGSGDTIHMDGVKVFSTAVRRMTDALKRACESHELTVGDLDLVIAHQANQRILDAIGQRLKLPAERLYSNVRNFGNTSSSTIPICLSEIFHDIRRGQRIGLAAFGGGFTYGAALLEGT